MDPAKKKKWLGIAKRYPGMTPEEQHRTQLQMRDWYSLTPEQRELVREKVQNDQKAAAGQAPRNKAEMARV